MRLTPVGCNQESRQNGPATLKPVQLERNAMSEVLEMPEAKTTIATLPPADRAALVLNSTKTEADLKQLASSLKAITLVNSPAGREQAHALAMTARSARTAIEKAGKLARDDATKFSKAVIAEEDRLIEIIQPEETRVLGLRNAWDAAEAARKEAEARAERERIERHQAVIGQIKGYPSLARDCRTAAMALQMLEKLHQIDISKLDEFFEQARSAMITADEQINEVIDTKKAAESEAARIKAEQEETAHRLAEQQAELLAQQARMKAQQEELDRQAAAMAQQAAELEARKTEAEKPAEVLANDDREALAQIVGTCTVLSEKPMADENARNFIDAVWPEPLPAPVIVPVPAAAEEIHDTGKSIMYGQAIPTAVDLANTIAYAQGVTQETVIRWLAHRADTFKTLAESQA
jgi:hypothetical protein